MMRRKNAALPVRFVTYGSATQPLSTEALERVRKGLSTRAMYPVDDQVWLMKRFGLALAARPKID
jgi:hypothetical protein